MIIEKDLSIEIRGTNLHYFNLEEFNSDDDDIVLFYGYNWIDNPKLKQIVENYDKKYKVYLNVTMPTEFCGADKTIRDDFFDYVYGICPYTNKWLNELTNSNKYRTVWYAYNKNDIPEDAEKLYDVIYHGGLHGSKYTQCLDILQNFNYRYLTMTHGINGLTSNNLNKATDTNLSNSEKLEKIAQTKISVCYNNFSVRGIQDLNNIRARENWRGNEAFKHIEDLSIIPQIKSRFNEAAISRTLNLVEKDPWNIVENYYKPNVDFIYFNSNEELKDKIEEILNNWDDYQEIIDNAYNKALNYSTEKLINKIKTDILL